MALEIKGCEEGEVNVITNELFCKLRQEFCIYIKKCSHKCDCEKEIDTSQSHLVRMNMCESCADDFY